MKPLLAPAFAVVIVAATASSGLAQATITGPSTWAAGQPATVTWTASKPSSCAGGVRVVVNLSGTSIQSGSAVPLASGRSAIQGITVPAGTPVTLSLRDMCTGSLVAAAYAVRMTGSSAPVTPVAPVASNPITPQVRQNIDSACQGVLGAACSTSASYSSTYTAITQKIIQGSLKSDSSSIMYTYLIPMVQSSPSWEANIVDNAWRSIGCTGAAPEAQWAPRVPQLQTYQAMVNAMRQQGCSGAAANTSPAASSVQYATPQAIGAANTQVWGSLAGYAPVPTNCPAANGALSCSRSALAVYIKAHGTATLQTLAGPIYQQIVGQPLDSAHAPVLFSQFGTYWTGADDLAKYLQSTAGNWRTVKVGTTLAGLNAQGCLVDPSGAKLAANESCGLYLLDSKGVHAPSAYPFTLSGKRVSPTSASAGGGVMMSNGGSPLMLVTTATQWAIGNNIVAQGAGNIVAQGAGNIVAQGAGNIVAQSGGNIILNAGGNIVAQGAGNLIQNGGVFSIHPAVMDSFSAARSAGLLDLRGASIISQDGGSLLASASSLPAIASAIGENSSGLISRTSASVISDNGLGLISNNPTSLLTDNGAALRTTQSVSSPMAATITGPSTWTYGQPAMITWQPSSSASPCASGYKVLLNGSTPVGNAVTLTLGKSLLQANLWPRGTVSVALQNVCTGVAATRPFTMKIQ